MSKYCHIKLSSILKDIGGNSKLSNKYISEHHGEYPVYSAKTTGDLIKGYIDSYKYNMECLQITSDGANAGTVIYRKKQKFSIGPATRVYYLKNAYTQCIYLKYLFYQLKKILISNEYSWTNKATKYKIDEIIIPIPLKDNEEIDLQKQISIAEKLDELEIKKNNLILIKQELQKITIDINFDKYNHDSFPIKDIFDLSIPTNNSKFTKSFIKNNPGNIPVYGASKNVEEVGYGYVEDNLKDVKYFENCLTYNIDASAGYVFYRKNRFSLSEKVRPLIIKKSFIGKLYEPYLEYIIQPIFRANIRGRRGPNGENEFTKINKTIISDLEIPIPVDENGECNLQAQIEIADKYMKLENIKKQVCNEIDKVLSINLEL